MTHSIIKDFLASHRHDKTVLVLLGPTASGKTALSLELAHEFNGEIISADSRQVYRNMDIGTDKIPLEKRESIPHCLIDVVDPDERFTVAHFKQLAEEKIDDILARGKLPMLVGGTGLYIRAVTENFQIPPESPVIRRQIESEFVTDKQNFGEEQAKVHLYDRLKKLDPAGAAKIHPNNLPYVVRALEIVMATGKSKNDQKNPPKYKCLKIGLTWPRDKLTGRINLRVDHQIQNGLIDETQKLLEMGYAQEIPSMRSLGYQEMVQFINGGLSKEEAIALLKKNTRDFAKRQMTWFNKESDITWIPMEK